MPSQRRGEKRLEELIAAAMAEFSAVGYEPATMQSIADRAGAPIGSLYQFFPNKQAVARALRTRQIEDVERLWTGLEAPTLAAFVDRFVRLMVRFVEDHPAFLPLLDAPASTQPIGPRHRLRGQLACMLGAFEPRLGKGARTRVAEIVLSINKALMGLYARSAPEDRRWILAEYRRLLASFLGERLAVPRKPGARGAGRAGGGNGHTTGVRARES